MSTSSSKNCSKPAGEMISRIRQGSSPAFQKVCHWSRGLWTRSPGPASSTSSPSSAPMRPSSTKLYSSSRVCGCSGAASARGDMGCSTSEKRSPASAPSIMKRTPMLPRKPALPSCGPTTSPTRSSSLLFLRSLANLEERDDVPPRAVAPAAQDVHTAAALVRAVGGPAGGQRPVDDDRRRVARLHDASDLREVVAIGLPVRGGEPGDLLAPPYVDVGTARREDGMVVEQLRQPARVADDERVLEPCGQLLGSVRSGCLALHLCVLSLLHGGAKLSPGRQSVDPRSLGFGAAPMRRTIAA